MNPRSIHVVALLDPPSPRSFAQVPFIERGTTMHQIHGFGPTAGPDLTDEEVERVLHDGSARPADITAEVEPDAEPLSAGMLGLAFIEAFHRLSLPPPRTTTDAYLLPDVGWVWIDRADRIEAVRERWILDVAPLAFRQRSFEIAELMQWAMATHDHTSAAIWYTLPPRLAKEEVTFQVRLRQGQGDTTIDEPTLRQRFETIRDRYLAIP